MTFSPDTHFQQFLQLTSYAALVEKEINVRQIQLSVQVCFPDNYKTAHFTLPLAVLKSGTYLNKCPIFLMCIHVFNPGSSF